MAGAANNIVHGYCGRWPHKDRSSNPYQKGLARLFFASIGPQSVSLPPNPFSCGFFVADGLLLIRFTPSKTEPSIRRKVNTEILSRPLRGGFLVSHKIPGYTADNGTLEGLFQSHKVVDWSLVKAGIGAWQFIRGVPKASHKTNYVWRKVK